MATNNPRGFVEHRNLAGTVNPKTQKFKVKANGVSGSHDKRAGDPVVLVSGHSVARIPVAGTAAGLPVVGVIRAVHNSNDRPLTHNLPSTEIALEASTAGYVYVNTDPHQTYLVNTDATVVSTLIGQFVDVTANTPNSAAGRSGFSIEVATGSNTAGNTLAFQVIGIGANNLDQPDQIVGGQSNQDVEVIIARHVFANTNKAR